ncbi:MAG: hypothetical protein AUJ49_07345 [Desulfovibrionaceae bacterium CG1_02_65_16]|nr:MAG: hypothetical protein AUJ49_07345 [Desulfovibrionaceae bacterium CG1_02_65_16]
MAETVEELTISYEEDGVVVTDELDKVILSKGAWATVLYKYRSWDKAKNGYGPVAFTIRRYRKQNGEYKQQSKFTISSEDQARKIIGALEGWIGKN